MSHSLWQDPKKHHGRKLEPALDWCTILRGLPMAMAFNLYTNT